MSWTVKMAYVFIAIIFCWLYQEQNQEWDILRNHLKKANNFAVHDAAQYLDNSELLEGRLVIDPVAARAAFEETLKLNLGLDDSFIPKPGSRLRDSVRILNFTILDETNTTFPYLYDNPAHRLAKWLQGPAVVAVIETDHPDFVAYDFAHSPIRVPAIYEYNPNK